MIYSQLNDTKLLIKQCMRKLYIEKKPSKVKLNILIYIEFIKGIQKCIKQIFDDIRGLLYISSALSENSLLPF